MQNQRQKILIVDDEPYIREFVGEVLSSEFQVTFANGGNNALESIKKSKPSLIVLDLLMPNMNGYKLCEVLKGESETKDIPVVILSALNDPESSMKAYSLGAADYIQKPFHPDELLLRVKTKLGNVSIEQPVYIESKKSSEFGNVQFTPGSRTLKVKQKETVLPDIESSILAFLIEHKDEICTREAIAEAVWKGEGDNNPRNLDPHVSSLRKKLKGGDHSIHTVYGSGYIFKKN
jgi:DNA-binding response OmpR family regulator